MDTQGRIDKAMEHIRSMGFSITPKMHGMESHVVRQMRTIPGGIGKLMEHWIEQYHQTGFRFDMAYCRVGSLVGQAAIRSSAEKRARNPRVQMSKMLLQKSFVGIRKRRSAAIESDEKKTQIKQERRDNALAEISATIELDKKEAILAKLKVDEDTEDLDELAKLDVERRRRRGNASRARRAASNSDRRRERRRRRTLLLPLPRPNDDDDGDRSIDISDERRTLEATRAIGIWDNGSSLVG